MAGGAKTEVRVGGAALANHLPMALIAGPCALEDERHCLRLASELKKTCENLGIDLIFKASFDKANRSSATSFRGSGIKEGLRILGRVKRELALPVTTDIHLPEQCAPAAEVVDLLQIPAFLCRQSDLLTAAAATALPINLKKGQFVAPWDIAKSAEKIGHRKVLLTERGSSFGYNRLVADMCGLREMGKSGLPVVFDASHSAQQPGGRGATSGGDRSHVELLARSAVAVGIAALFLEVHDNPDEAPCDGDTMLELSRLDALLSHLKAIDSRTKAYLY